MENFLGYWLSCVYYLGLKFHQKITVKKKLPFPVVSVGNITTGGTGKTPVVEIVCRELLALGWHPAVLSRGYRRKKTPEPLIISDGKNILSHPDYSGDEPYLLARHLRNVAIIVGKNRYQAGLLLPAMGLDIAVLDDGFQHWGLKRDRDIVCLDATNPFGNGWVLPAGILREPASALSRANLIFLNKINLIDKEERDKLFEHLFKKVPGVPVITTEYEIDKIVGKNQELGVADLVDKKVVLISGIARPESFEKTVVLSGIKFVKHFKFADHHYFRQSELEEIFQQYPGAIFLTTEKDYWRLNEKYDRIFYARLQLRYDRERLRCLLPQK